MSKNNNLHKAKKEANDEFYTQYEDLAKNIDIVKDENIEKLIAFVYEKGYSDGRLCYRCDLEKVIKNHPDL